MKLAWNGVPITEITDGTENSIGGESLTIDWLPDHKCGLFLTHNRHKDFYETAKEYTERDYVDEWVSEEEKQKAIETDSIWELQWYPDTPIGFYVIRASTLEAIIKAVKEFRKEDND